MDVDDPLDLDASDDDDSEDDAEELMLELQKIKKERMAEEARMVNNDLMIICVIKMLRFNQYQVGSCIHLCYLFSEYNLCTYTVSFFCIYNIY